MTAQPQQPPQPRRQPRQARAIVTREAIFEATVQLLLVHGPERLTTTRIAERAGVSVGTLYQYFPHKEALIYALLARHLDLVADYIGEVCRRCHGMPAGAMAETLVAGYVNAKTTRVDVTRALYRGTTRIDKRVLVHAFQQRLEDASRPMLASASDLRFADLEVVTVSLLTMVTSSVCSLFDRDIPMSYGNAYHDEVATMCRSYVAATGKPAMPAARANAGDWRAMADLLVGRFDTSSPIFASRGA